MAWPPLSSRPEASSCSTHVCLRWRSDPPWHRRHRRRKQSHAIGPSSTLLSLLASLVSASTTSASPAPPSFLCPSIGSDNTIPTWCHNKRTPPLEKAVDNHPPYHESGRRKLRRVPNKFVEGEDGIWRRVESYTLYGVTAPNRNCNDENCPPTRPISSIGLPLNGTLTPTHMDIQLPPGWQTAPQATNSRTTMILAVSLALSLFICFLIIICLFWRKGLLKKKKKSQDVEATHWRRNRQENHTSEEHRNIEVEKEARALQKIWARASARWKANARYSLRQRRGKRYSARSHNQSTAMVVDDSCSRLMAQTSRPPSILSSPIPHNHAPLVEQRHPNRERENPTSRPSSPPAYQTDHQLPPIIISSPEQTTSPSEYSAPSNLSRRPSHYSFNAHPHLPDINLFPAAHVATDDKTRLAQLADLASAPPNEADTVVDMPLTQVPAPEELEIGGLTVSPILSQEDSAPSASLFPPPPSKERLAAVERLEYTFAYDNLEPEPEPSAPPFEENSPIPPLDESILFPSAPPLIDDEAGRVLGPLSTCLPTAPELEDVPSPQDMSYAENANSTPTQRSAQ